MQVLVVRERRTSPFLVQEKSKRLLVHEDFRDETVAIGAKARSELPPTQDH